MLTELRNALFNAALVEAIAARDAIVAGWLVEEVGASVETTEALARIYKTRAAILASRQDEHSRRLAASVAEFATNLPLAFGKQGQWLRIHQNNSRYFLCYVTVPKVEVVGCMLVQESTQDGFPPHVTKAA